MVTVRFRGIVQHDFASEVFDAGCWPLDCQSASAPKAADDKLGLLLVAALHVLGHF